MKENPALTITHAPSASVLRTGLFYRAKDRNIQAGSSNWMILNKGNHLLVIGRMAVWRMKYYVFRRLHCILSRRRYIFSHSTANTPSILVTRVMNVESVGIAKWFNFFLYIYHCHNSCRITIYPLYIMWPCTVINPISLTYITHTAYAIVV